MFLTLLGCYIGWCVFLAALLTVFYKATPDDSGDGGLAMVVYWFFGTGLIIPVLIYTKLTNKGEET